MTQSYYLYFSLWSNSKEICNITIPKRWLAASFPLLQRMISGDGPLCNLYIYTLPLYRITCSCTHSQKKSKRGPYYFSTAEKASLCARAAYPRLEAKIRKESQQAFLNGPNCHNHRKSVLLRARRGPTRVWKAKSDRQPVARSLRYYSKRSYPPKKTSFSGARPESGKLKVIKKTQQQPVLLF